MSASGWASARGRPAEPTTDAALVRRVRRRLLLWSGGSTLDRPRGPRHPPVRGRRQLPRGRGERAAPRARPDDRHGHGHGRRRSRSSRRSAIARTPGDPGVLIGGVSSGTIAFVTTANGQILGGSKPLTVDTPVGSLIDNDDIATAAATGRDVVGEQTVAGTSWRLYTCRWPRRRACSWSRSRAIGPTSSGRSRSCWSCWCSAASSAVGASLLVGRVYADRALVPIRDAMRRQREFAADASHELRTPLAVVQGASRTSAATPTSPSPRSVRPSTTSRQATDRLAALVDDLLVLARTDSGAVELELRPTDFGDLALDAVGELAGVAAARSVSISSRRRAGAAHRRSRPAPPARRHPRRQRDPAAPAAAVA